MEVRCFAPRRIGQQLDFLESVLATAAIRACRKTTPRSTRCTGPATAAASSSRLTFTRLTKPELGLPRWRTPPNAQRRDGMCWHESGRALQRRRAFKARARSRCERRDP